MACGASLFKADGLAAFRTGLTQQAVLMFGYALLLFAVKISFRQNLTYGIRYGKDKAIFLEDGVFSANPFELPYNFDMAKFYKI